MNSLELIQFLKQDPECKKYFLCVFARDRLPKVQKLPSCFILNTDNHNEPGEHWLAMFFNIYNQAEFFDSYGLHPRVYGLEEYLNENSKSWTYNNKRFQSFYSNMCGEICLFYLFFKCRNFSLFNIQNMFTKDYEKNELLIKYFLKNFV